MSTLAEFVVSKHVMQLVSTPNIFSYLFKEVNYKNVATEFIRFMKFIEKHDEPGKSELPYLILPVTIHLYVILMQIEDVGVDGARTFLNLGINILHHGEGHREAMAALSSFNDIQELKQDPYFKNYIAHKTVIEMSKDVFKSLQNFLINIKNYIDGTSILVHVLSFNIHFVNSDGYQTNKISSREEKDLKLENVDLENIEILRLVLYSKGAGLYSVDFNCAVTEIAYAIRDAFIYSLAITVPVEKKRRSARLKNMKPSLSKIFQYKDSDLKSTRIPGNDYVSIVKYLPNEPFRLLAVCSSRIRLFDTKKCTFLAEYNTDGSFINDIDIDSTSQFFATANPCAAYIYAFHLNSTIWMLNDHEKAVLTVKFHPNGMYVATGSEDCTVRLFEVESSRCVRLFVGHLFGVRKMDFSPDGNLIASADSSGLVNVWNIKDCIVISKLAMPIKGTIFNVINSLCFQENSFLLAISVEKGEVVFWDTRNPDKRRTFRSFKKPIKICHKGKSWNIVYTCEAVRGYIRRRY